MCACWCLEKFHYFSVFQLLSFYLFYFILFFKRQIPPQQPGIVEPLEKATERSPQVDEAKMLSTFC